jgi:hypothetical protein
VPALDDGLIASSGVRAACTALKKRVSFLTKRVGFRQRCHDRSGARRYSATVVTVCHSPKPLRFDHQDEKAAERSIGGFGDLAVLSVPGARHTVLLDSPCS